MIAVFCFWNCNMYFNRSPKLMSIGAFNFKKSREFWNVLLTVLAFIHLREHTVLVKRWRCIATARCLLQIHILPVGNIRFFNYVIGQLQLNAPVMQWKQARRCQRIFRDRNAQSNPAGICRCLESHFACRWNHPLGLLSVVQFRASAFEMAPFMSFASNMDHRLNWAV